MTSSTQPFGEMDPIPNSDLPPLIINACLTGMVPHKKENLFLPVTSEEIIEDACTVIEAGASILHLHARDPQGEAAWEAAAYAPIIQGIRAHYPDVIIGVTTSGRKFADFAKRAAVLDLRNGCKPDMASLTLGSMNFAREAAVNSPETIQKLATCMLDRGIIPELEVFGPGMLNYAFYLVKKKILPERCYVNFILGSLGASPARVFDLANLVRDLPHGWIWAAAGLGRYQLSMNTTAIVMGGHVRVGLEDNLFYDIQRKTVASNKMLVDRLVRVAGELGRPIATPGQTRKMLGLESVRKKN